MAQQLASKKKTSHPKTSKKLKGSKVYSDILDHFSYQNYKIIITILILGLLKSISNWTSILVLHFKFESSICKPDPLRPVIHTTHPFCRSNFCLSSLPTEDSCQKIFADFPSVDIREWFLSGQKQRHGIKRLNITKNVDGKKQILLMVHFKMLTQTHYIKCLILSQQKRLETEQWNS